jgi:hypothetical protein
VQRDGWEKGESKVRNHGNEWVANTETSIESGMKDLIMQI